MGYILAATCKNCCFKQDVSFGAGMLNSATVCDVPGINRKTGKLVEANFFDEEELKSDIIFYTEPLMFKGDIMEDYLDWGGVLIKRHDNICPQCKDYSLEFIPDVLFD